MPSRTIIARMPIACVASAFLCAAGCAASQANAPEPQPEPAAATPGLHEVFPGVRVDVAARVVEFAGAVPIDAHNEDGTPIFLECVVCGKDSREHESLVVTDVLASHVHAALLMIGLHSGHPGGFRPAPAPAAGAPGTAEAVPPTGDGVRVEFVFEREGREVVEQPTDWIKHDKTGARLDAAGATKTGFVFAGSRFVTRQGREWYDADGAGTLIGLHTFGSEAIAWRDVMSPEANVEEPAWVADPARTPATGTKVVVRLSPER